ncbi:MAG: alpha/beta hydrolase domain-containing protein, partial [Actinomycetota bacterium]|nr:alpha/beta hydrolase domain-containing protein [Actinomycetota bacterium]
MGFVRNVSWIVAFAGMAVALWAGPASAGMNDIPTSTVSGPIAVAAGSHPYLATDIDLERYRYVEHEYFLEGQAYRYDTGGAIDEPAPRIETGGPGDDGRFPFRTRIVVRRPAVPAEANGTVIAEWNNVTSTQDVEFNWFGDPYFLLKNGYTFVGVTAQSIGVNSLKSFDAGRYSSLTVNGNGAVPGPDADALSYDIFSSVVKALKGGRNGVDPLGGITPSTVIASGESQSCSRLSGHYNRIEPVHEIVDAYLLTVCTAPLRTDRPEKAVRIISENENRIPRTAETLPDTASIRHWEVAGGSHLPRIAFDNLNPVFTRDFAAVTAECQKFPLSLVKWPYTQNAAIRHIVEWAGGGAAPPIAARGQYLPDNTLDRDEYGIARGGIRYPDVTVPVAVNDGINDTGAGGSLFSLFCGLFGSSTPFDQTLLHSIYTDHSDYVTKYSRAADEMVGTGFILQEDADRLKEDARAFARLRPAAPVAVKRATRGAIRLSWIGTEADQSTFTLERSRAKGARKWRKVKRRPIAMGRVTLGSEPQGTHVYRVSSRTTLPGTNISAPETVVTPFSVASRTVKVDRTGPRKPRIVTGEGARGVYRGRVKVKVVGRPDRRLPDGSAGVGLNPKS